MIPSLAKAQARQVDLDSAFHFWRTSMSLLGQPTTSSGGGFTQYDSIQDVNPALNLALRAVARSAPIMKIDTLWTTSVNFIYTIDSNFIENGLPVMPFQAQYHDTSTGQLIELKWASKEEIQANASGVTVGNQTGAPAFFRIEGDRLWIAPDSKPSKRIYVIGPAKPSTMRTGFSTTNFYKTDRDLVVLYMAALLANSRGEDGKRDFLMSLYKQGVFDRTGRMPGAIQ